jgi:hypothetical protein
MSNNICFDFRKKPELYIKDVTERKGSPKSFWLKAVTKV